MNWSSSSASTTLTSFPPFSGWAKSFPKYPPRVVLCITVFQNVLAAGIMAPYRGLKDTNITAGGGTVHAPNVSSSLSANV